MTTNPILAFIESRINQAQRKAKIRRRNNDEKGKRLRPARSAVRQKTTIGSYIYAIVVDDVVRYIGKGRNGRMYTHLVEAKRTSARCPAETAHLYPRIHRKLVETEHPLYRLPRPLGNAQLARTRLGSQTAVPKWTAHL
jgi:hypothetical protein